MKAYYRPPEPKGREEFLRRVAGKGRLSPGGEVMGQGDFLIRQLSYIHKGEWGLAGLVFLLLGLGCIRQPQAPPFAMTALLAAGILTETRRSRRWGMYELEAASRFSAGSVMLSRAFWVGLVDTLGLAALLAWIRPWLPCSFLRGFFYMMVPYLLSALVGAWHERRHRRSEGAGSILICGGVALAFALAPRLFRGLYGEELVLGWALVFGVLLCGSLHSLVRWAKGKEPGLVLDA